MIASGPESPALSGAAAGPPAALGDTDRDALHILPLHAMPIATPGLRGARLIRNGRLQTMVELFAGAEMGSGQIAIEDAGKEFGWVKLPPHSDLILLRKLAGLASYDVYSLRILLRESGIAVNSMDALRLSPAKMTHLTAYMTDFTRPLLTQIYGGEDISFQSLDDLIALFRSPDVERARQKLTQMAARLGIRIEEIPKFLEDYGDVFMSVSYYRNCLDAIRPPMADFLDSLQEIRGNRQLAHDQDLMHACQTMQRTMTGLTTRTARLLSHFTAATNGMWDNLSAERFRMVESTIKGWHTTIGAVLCALTVKINAWERTFPDKNVGGVMKRAEFIVLEMKQGFELIHAMKDTIPLLAAR